MTNNYPESPVKADSYLMLGEKPFTAFGQFGQGQIDLRVVDQDIYWVAENGEPLLIDDMTYNDTLKVFIELFSLHENLHKGELNRYSVESLMVQTQADELPVIFVDYVLHKLNPQDHTASSWIQETALYKKLILKLDELN